MSDVIIGSNGYIGRHIAKSLLERSREVQLYDRHDNSVDGYDGYHAVDIVQPGFSIDLSSCETVFFMAGLTGALSSIENYCDFINVNELGLLNLLSQMRAQNCNAKVIYPSTRLVYRGSKGSELTEESEKEFKTIYAVNKYASEQYLAMFNNCCDINYTIFRICVPYGNQIDESLSYGTINHFVAQARKGDALTIFGDGEQKRTLTHIGDVVNVMIGIGLNSRSDCETYNIGGETLSIRSIAEQIAQTYRRDLVFKDWREIDRRLESGDTVFSDAKLQVEFGYEYQNTFKEWLASNH